MSDGQTITFTLTGRKPGQYTVPTISVWEMERMQELFADGIAAGNLREHLKTPTVLLKYVSSLLTLLFDSGDLLPEHLQDAPFEKQRRWVSRLLSPDDLEHVGEQLASGMPSGYRRSMEQYLGKASETPEMMT
jgi:hypothetical protein